MFTLKSQYSQTITGTEVVEFRVPPVWTKCLTLPENCQKYIRFIEEYCGTDIAMVSVSPERDGNIILKELL